MRLLKWLLGKSEPKPKPVRYMVKHSFTTVRGAFRWLQHRADVAAGAIGTVTEDGAYVAFPLANWDGEEILIHITEVNALPQHFERVFSPEEEALRAQVWAQQQGSVSLVERYKQHYGQRS